MSEVLTDVIIEPLASSPPFEELVETPTQVAPTLRRGSFRRTIRGRDEADTVIAAGAFQRIGPPFRKA